MFWTRIGLTYLLIWMFDPCASASPLTVEENRGKQLYVNGTRSSGEVVKVMIGQQSIELPGSKLPCAGCHGEDGQGRPEGGIIPVNITWRFLTKSYGHQHPNSRKHPAFTELSFAAAVTAGMDPAGNHLDIAMPRYQLSSSDIADLIAYLKRLSTDYDPGLTETIIRVGSLLPAKGSLGGMGRAMHDVIAAYFAEINAGGGIYNRKIMLDVAEFSGDPEATLKSFRLLLESEPVFAIVASVAGGMEKEILALTESSAIPHIGPYTLFPETGFSSSRSTFYLLSGLKQQSRALVDYAVNILGLKSPVIALTGTSGVFFQNAAEGIETQRKKHGWGKVTQLPYPRGGFDAQQLAAKFKTLSPDALFYFGDDQTLPALLTVADQLTPRPYVFMSGSLAGQNIFNVPSGFNDRIFLTYPTLPRDQTNLREFEALMRKHGLSKQHLTAQIFAYSSAKLLVVGLQRAGKKLNRKKLIQILESMYQYDNGLTPPLTYGPNRHIGSVGAYVVKLNLKTKNFIGESLWIEPR